ncbi:hypothetical protein [Alsobacter soli]|nr:hypothetical protein [Alsobacter soli]
MTYLFFPIDVDWDDDDELIDPLDLFLESGVIGGAECDRITVGCSDQDEGFLIRFQSESDAFAAKLAVPSLVEPNAYAAEVIRGPGTLVRPLRGQGHGLPDPAPQEAHRLPPIVQAGRMKPVVLKFEGDGLFLALALTWIENRDFQEPYWRHEFRRKQPLFLEFKDRSQAFWFKLRFS